MNRADEPAFTKMIKLTAEQYGKPMSADLIAFYFNGLAYLPIEKVRAALNAHVHDPDAGQFMPKIADVIRNVPRAPLPMHQKFLPSPRPEDAQGAYERARPKIEAAALWPKMDRSWHVANWTRILNSPRSSMLFKHWAQQALENLGERQ